MECKSLIFDTLAIIVVIRLYITSFMFITGCHVATVMTSFSLMLTVVDLLNFSVQDHPN